ncbi:DUF2878 domain-containing protein [Catenovulum sp. SM1970]|uniref:DUF2878 domain-containing protein n=1 Tax=Marinifaba aquimaris TaxID=2741323 RepID=UPI001FE541CB|nr:DUF2878 domain-containing protein [Marinifaba aquimaris]NTS77755.1 DUF2878 domain-containing protein [Marinifaba aquimaris]
MLKLISFYNNPWFNLLWFKTIWFAAVVFQDQITSLLFIVFLFHFALSIKKFTELTVMLAIGLIGCFVDGSLIALGLLPLPEQSLGFFFIPNWLLFIWLAFATTLIRVLKPLDNHLKIAALLGAIFGPVSYSMGINLSNPDLANTNIHFTVSLAFTWAILFPLLLRVGNLIYGHTKYYDLNSLKPQD